MFGPGVVLIGVVEISVLIGVVEISVEEEDSDIFENIIKKKLKITKR